MAEPGAERWREAAACRTSSIDFFDERQFPAAIAVCRSCRVAEPCRSVAVEGDIPDGIWGGLTPHERRALKIRARHRPDGL